MNQVKEFFGRIIQRDNIKLATQVIPAVAMLLLAVFGLQKSMPVFPPIPAATAAVAEKTEQRKTPERPEKPAEKAAALTAKSEVQVEPGTGHFPDGVHTGTGNGFHGPVKVKVTVKDGQITAIEVLSNQDDAAFFNKAKTGLIPNILKAQTWEVDSVTGASYSSRGIKEAVKNALTGGKSAPSTSAAATSSPTQLTAVKPGKGTYTDGVHTGTGTGFRGPITVRVSVQNGQITDITVVSYKDDDSFFNRAKTLINTIKTAQTWEVDSVTGASYSSRGIKEAVKNALTGSTSASSRSSPASPVAAAPGGVSKPASSGYTAPKSGYKDGTYYGTAKGFGGMVKTKVVIKNGKITSVSVVSAPGETASYLNRAKAITGRIVSQQSPNVDTISGATFSSNAIREGAKNALRQAAGKEVKQSKKKKRKKAAAKPSGRKLSGSYKNGTYTGTAKGFGGDITVRITIKNNAITKLKVIKASGETASFLAKAKDKVIALILSRQTTKVDGAAGATYSSKGIKNAVAAALKQAKSGSKKDDGKTKPATPTKPTTPTKPSGKKLSGKHKNGTYKGTAKGFGGDITVSVTIKDNAITKLKVLKASGETISFLNKAKNKVIPLILDRQTTKVDGAAGATYSSKGIKNAVAEALKQAKSGSKKDDGKTKPSTPTEPATPTEPTTPTKPGGKKLSGKHKNGTFKGTAEGFGGDITVSVTIKDNAITKLKVLKAAGETPSFLNKAKNKMIPLILNRQTTKVDGAAGATYSSRGIKNAVAAALKKAVPGTNKDDDEQKPSKPTKPTTPTKPTGKKLSGKYRNGTYTGVGNGYKGGEIQVTIVIKDNAITRLTVDSAEKQTEPFITNAKNKVLPLILANQTVKVDAATGATRSSKGIMDAVADALEKAQVGGESDDFKEEEESEEDKPKEDEPKEENPKEEDEEHKEDEKPKRSGTYSASATVHPDAYGEFTRYTLQISVTFQDGKVSAISGPVLSVAQEDEAGDDEDYSEYAASKLFPVLKSKGSTEGVDTVSGATCSSNAILEAFEDACGQADAALEG